MSRQSKLPLRIRNLSLAAVAGLAGVASVIITLTGLFVGLWLDARLQVRGVFAISLLVISVPVSLFTMMKIVLEMVGRIVPQPLQHSNNHHAPDVEEESL